MHIGFMDTQSFTWTAAGNSDDEVKRALLHAFNTAQSTTPFATVDDLTENYGVTVMDLSPGDVYRDDVKLVSGGGRVTPTVLYHEFTSALPHQTLGLGMFVEFRNEKVGDLIVVRMDEHNEFYFTIADYTDNHWDIVLNHGDPFGDDVADQPFENITDKIGWVPVNGIGDQAEVARRLVFYIESEQLVADMAALLPEG